MNNARIEKIFQISAVILIGVAAYFLWRGNSDGLFVAGVLGAVCFFLSVRFQVKERMERREEEWLEEEPETEENLELNAPAEFAATENIEQKTNSPDKTL